MTEPTPSAWTEIRAAVDPLTRRTLGLYAAYNLTAQEYIGTFTHDEQPFEELVNRFEAAGYTRERLSAAKRHPDHRQLHLLSMRRVPDLHPFEPIINTGLDEYDGRQCQFHAHVFRAPGGFGYDVFMHYELRPDLRPVADEAIPEAISRMAAHYRPTWDRPDTPRERWTYLRGVTDPELTLD